MEMKAKRFNLNENEFKRIKKELKQKNHSFIFLQPHHIKASGEHKLILDIKNDKKVADLLAKHKIVPFKIYNENYKGRGISSKTTGGFIQLVFAGVGAVAAIIGSIAAAASAIKDWKHKNVEEVETQRHNMAIEEKLKDVKSVTIGKSVKKPVKKPTIKKKSRH